MVSDLEGQVTQREATFTAHEGQVSIEPRAGAEGLTIISAGGNGPKITMLAHDGENGAIVSTSGDLSFRFGNFLAGKDSERMRLTAEGKLGIGTEKPQAPLDVNGLIRTSEGIMFADGTILTTAAGQAVTVGGNGLIRRPGTPDTPITANQGNATKPGILPVRPPVLLLHPPAPELARPTPRPNATPGYQFVLDSTGVYAINLALPATTATSGVITVNGVPFAHSFGAANNTFLGWYAGNFTMTGLGLNTAIGSLALNSNTTGAYNTAIGSSSLQHNGGGSSNTAIGLATLDFNTDGNSNTAIGYHALNNSNGSSNVASGAYALENNSTGSSNVAIGYYALNTTTGGNNIAIGTNAGQTLTTGSANIEIGNVGDAADANTIRIGDSFYQTKAFIAGIRGKTTGNANAIPVLIDSAGQLGTMSSSRRYKFDISDMDRATDGLMQLRPVTFRYLAHGDNAPLQYGLIAEEVDQVYPELVARNKDGQVETVMYQFLAPMLLNEVQKQHRQIDEQQTTIDQENRKIEKQQTTIDALEQRLEALERQVAHDQ
jgi:polyhydroxyalkanoate synthesis regulator phasin